MRVLGGASRGAVLAIGCALAVAPARPAALDPARPIRQLGVRTFTTGQGLPQSSVTAIAQAPDGYLWVGTQVGLVRFDGVRFEPLEALVGGVAVDTVTALAVDGEGALWVGTLAGGLVRLRGTAADVFAGAPGLPEGPISALLRDGERGLLVAVAGTLVRWDGRAFHPAAPALPAGRVAALARAPDGAVWLGLEAGGVVRLAGGTATSFGRAQGLVSENVGALHVDRAGLVWIGTAEGELQAIERGRVLRAGARAGLGGHAIRQLLSDRDGVLWVGTSGGGACRLVAGRCEAFSMREGLAHDFVLALAEDAEGGLWVGTDGGGMTLLRDGPVTSFSAEDGLGADEVSAVFEDRDGALWVGAGGGAAAVRRGGAFRPLPGAAGTLRTVLAFAQTPDGDVWLGAREQGLVRIRGGEARPLGPADGVPSREIYALAAGSDGALWIGTHGAGLVRLRAGEARRFGRAEGLPDDRVTMLRLARDGSLWGATPAGLFHLRGDRAEPLELSPRRPRVAALWVHEDARGDLWVGTEGLGLARVRDGRVTTYGEREGIPESVVFAVLEDGLGNLWLSGNRGILRVARADLDALDAGRARQAPCAHLDRADGMRSSEANGGNGSAAFRGRDGRLWFATMGGLALVDPARLRGARAAPRVQIESAVADGVEHLAPAALSLRSGTEQLEVRYTAPAFGEPGELRFRYRAEGYDRDWVDAGRRRVAYYTSLPPGEYALRVEVREGDGPWTGAAPLWLRVERPFWRTGWFALLAAAAVAVLAVMGDRLRVARLQARRRELERLVEARTAELAVANRELERLSATDALTGVANRRAFDAALDVQFRLAARTGAPLSVAMVDIDAFKSFQDASGHAAGDACLAAVARALAALAPRATDLVARYGGEEFVVVLPTTDAAGALHVAERLRRGVEELGIPRAPGGGPLTVSIGVATASPPLGDDRAQALLERADRAMYRAKRLGRNRVAAEERGAAAERPVGQR